MLQVFAFLLLFAGLNLAARAEFKLPAGVYAISRLDEAMDKATREKKPLYFVLGHELSKEESELEVLKDTLNAGDKWSITVFVSLSEQLEMPPLILTSMAGGYLPMGFISTPEADKLWKFIRPATSPVPRAEMRKTVRVAIESCREDIAKWAKAERPVPPELPGNKELSWPQKNNTTPTRVFSKLKDGRVFFEGDREEIPDTATLLEDFRPATIRYIRFITGTAPAPKEEAGKTAAPAPTLEKWTNTAGKALQATFVSRKNGKVTLRTTDGTAHVLPLDSLSPVSQARALALGGAGK